MKNLYALLGTHILTDSQTIQKILDFKIHQNALDEVTIAQIRHYLLNPDKRRQYDQKLQQAYPDLLRQAQAVVAESRQKKNQRALVVPMRQSVTRHFSLQKILLVFVGIMVLIAMVYWSDRHSKKPYTKLAIITEYQTDLTPEFKSQLLTLTQTPNQPLIVDFNEANGMIVFNQGNQLQIWENSPTPQNNVWQTAIADNKITQIASQSDMIALWLPNQPVLNVRGAMFWRYDHSLGAIVLENKPPPPKIPRSYKYSDVVYETRSTDGNYVLQAVLTSERDMKLINAQTNQVYERKFQNRCCLVGWAKFSPDNKYLATNVPATNDPSVADAVFRIQTDANKNIIDLEQVAMVNEIDRKKSAQNSGEAIIKTDNLYFYRDVMVTINNNGDLRYWDLVKGKLLSEVKLDYKPMWTAQFSTDGRYLWYPNNKEIRVFDLKTGKDHYMAQNKSTDNKNWPKPIILGNKNLWLQNSTVADSDVLTATF